MKKLAGILMLSSLIFTSCEKEKAEIVTPCQTRAATSINVIVKDYVFEPATVNAVPGDTIIWTWQQGIHTTTSKSVPVGAASWDAIIDDSTPANHTFKYVVPVSGTYNYECTFHGSMMSGTIIASPPC
jgi:plastocyanin